VKATRGYRLGVTAIVLAAVAAFGGAPVLAHHSVEDHDCDEFASQAQAQKYFSDRGGSPSNNVDGLDADNDGVACEDHATYPDSTRDEVPSGTTPFTDINGNFFKRDIEWLWVVGITNGCSATLYCPAASVTREQMASFLARALELPQPTQDYFVDDETSFHENDINRLREANITMGCGTDPVQASPTFGEPIFCPRQAVTRAEMASFLARGLALPATATDYFTDDELSVFHEDNINRLREAGITNGCTTTTYCPDQPVTREQMAAFLHRAGRAPS
jgi:Excalibur calcium-binding domain/S-layer homology domain